MIQCYHKTQGWEGPETKMKEWKRRMLRPELDPIWVRSEASELFRWLGEVLHECWANDDERAWL